MSSRASSSNADDNDSGEAINIGAVKKLLRTSYHDVFQLSDDGLTYKKPDTLLGVPVQRITEDSPYWNPGWLSLEVYLAKETEEEDLKEEFRRRVALDVTNNKHLRHEAKRHQDNVSKHRKIRQIFKELSFPHPNQVVSKRYLPSQGLCDQETMYFLGCKVSDFQFLANRGLMDMEPWDFIRWRIGKVLADRIRLGLPGKVEVKNIIHNIGGEKSEDPLFRQAVLLSARLQGRSNAYGPKKTVGSYKVTGKAKLSFGNGRSAALPRSHMNKEALREEAEKARRERKAARLAQQQQCTGYQGVNAYRKQKIAIPGNGS
jgi:hypothetical protein